MTLVEEWDLTVGNSSSEESLHCGHALSRTDVANSASGGIAGSDVGLLASEDMDAPQPSEPPRASNGSFGATGDRLLWVGKRPLCPSSTRQKAAVCC